MLVSEEIQQLPDHCYWGPSSDVPSLFCLLYRTQANLRSETFPAIVCNYTSFYRSKSNMLTRINHISDNSILWNNLFNLLLKVVTTHCYHLSYQLVPWCYTTKYCPHDLRKLTNLKYLKAKFERKCQVTGDTDSSVFKDPKDMNLTEWKLSIDARSPFLAFNPK